MVSLNMSKKKQKKMEEKPNMKLRNIFESLIINETDKNLFTLASIHNYMKTLKGKQKKMKHSTEILLRE